MAEIAEAQGKVLAEYIWLDQNGTEMRNKTRVLNYKPLAVEDLPVIVVDARNNYEEELSEVFLKPRKLFPDPFRGGEHVLVLCDSFRPPSYSTMCEGSILQPTVSNNRVASDNLARRAAMSQPLFAAEQQYSVVFPNYPKVSPYSSPFHAPNYGVPHYSSFLEPGGFVPSTSASCDSGSTPLIAPTAIGRTVSDAHLQACLYAGIRVSSADSNCIPGTYSYELGPYEPVEFGDAVSTSRYLLRRVAEENNVNIDFSSRNKDGGGGRCSVKYSTSETRQISSGMNAIQNQLSKLQASHLQHLWAYNGGSFEKMRGSLYSGFICAVGNKNASLVIPGATAIQGAGYYIDQRPPADVDPYVVEIMLMSCTLGIELPLALSDAPRFNFPLWAIGSGASLTHSHLQAIAMANNNFNSALTSSFSPKMNGELEKRINAGFGILPSNYAVNDSKISTGCSYDNDCDEGDDGMSESSEELLIDELEKIDDEYMEGKHGHKKNVGDADYQRNGANCHYYLNTNHLYHRKMDHHNSHHHGPSYEEEVCMPDSCSSTGESSGECSVECTSPEYPICRVARSLSGVIKQQEAMKYKHKAANSKASICDGHFLTRVDSSGNSGHYRMLSVVTKVSY
nr:glutamine synthetase (glnA) [Polytomella parva]